MKRRVIALFLFVAFFRAEDVPAQASLSPEEALDALTGPMDAGAQDMSNLLDDAVRKLANKRNEEALVKLKKKDYPGALDLLK